MINQLKLAVVIPTYNAQNTILEVVNQVANYLSEFKNNLDLLDYSIVVVIDGCKNKYQDLDYAESILKSLIIIKREINGGVGAATITGFEYSFNELNVDLCVKIDADLQMCVDEIKLFIEINKYRNNVTPLLVKGERLSSKNFSKFKIKRLVGNLILNSICLITTASNKSADPACGYILINKSFYLNLIVENLKTIKKDYLFETSLLFLAIEKKSDIENCPVTPIYINHYSSMSEYSTGIKLIIFMLKRYYYRILYQYIFNINKGSIYIITFTLTGILGYSLGLTLFIDGIISQNLAKNGVITLWLIVMIINIFSLFKFIDYDLKKL
jgi:dolichol-phosphate mannosyltransferase